MAVRKGWDNLRPDYRERLERKGVTREDYDAGVPLSKARGHEHTPESPKSYDPQKYQKYDNERQRLYTELQAKKEAMFGHSARWDAERSEKTMKEYPPPLSLLRWAVEAEEDELYENLVSDPETYAFLGYH